MTTMMTATDLTALAELEVEQPGSLAYALAGVPRRALRTEWVTAMDLLDGDVIAEHGCLILLSARRTFPGEGGSKCMVAHFTGTLVDDRDGDNPITSCFPSVRRGGNTWAIQGNELARYSRVTGVADPSTLAPIPAQRGATVPTSAQAYGDTYGVVGSFVGAA